MLLQSLIDKTIIPASSSATFLKGFGKFYVESEKLMCNTTNCEKRYLRHPIRRKWGQWQKTKKTLWINRPEHVTEKGEICNGSVCEIHPNRLALLGWNAGKNMFFVIWYDNIICRIKRNHCSSWSNHLQTSTMSPKHENIGSVS